MIESKLLHQSECMRIEYYYKLNRENRQLAFVFSSLGSRTLNGNVNGGDFLIENGFDVVNFNSNGLEWFQETPKEIFSSVRALDGYERRVAMGSSMGGFAAIAFSKLLECDLVLAYAPQSDALMQFDGRFADIVRNLHWVYPVSELADSKCKYFVVYDNKNALDTMHAQHLRSILQHGYSEITIPFAGHAVVFYLLELGLLKQVTLSVLTARPLPLQDLRRNRRVSRQYLATLSEQLAAKKHFRLSANVKQLIKDHYETPAVISWAIDRKSSRLSPLAERLEMQRLRRRHFDEDFYAHLNWDVVQTGLPPLLHYVRYGRSQNRIIRFKKVTAEAR